jgi:hypothetical protein
MNVAGCQPASFHFLIDLQTLSLLFLSMDRIRYQEAEEDKPGIVTPCFLELAHCLKPETRDGFEVHDRANRVEAWATVWIQTIVPRDNEIPFATVRLTGRAQKNWGQKACMSVPLGRVRRLADTGN